MMKKAGALGSLWLGVGLAACGPSRIVLTVDVLSCLRADSLDAFSFGVRGGVPQTDLTVSRPFSIPSRFGPGNVDSVAVTAGAILESTQGGGTVALRDRKSTRLNSSHDQISYAVFCLKKKKLNRAEPQVLGVPRGGEAFCYGQARRSSRSAICRAGRF